MGTLSSADRACTQSSPSAGIHRCVTELDVQLMCRARDGDAHAFGLLVERNRRPLITFLRRIVPTSFAAEELAQEVFLRVYRARSSYEPSAKFTTWLFRIASHTAINWLRDGRRHFQESLEDRIGEASPRQYSDGRPTIEECLLADVRAQEIRAAIKLLPMAQRTAVILHKYCELEYRQIAVRLQCSESAVKSLLFRAYEQLRAKLAHLEHTT